MGRKPEPEHVRAMRGKKPRIPKDEQLVHVQAPVTIMPPSYLNDEAQHHWERMTLLLSGIGLLQEVGKDKLGRYCQACADYEEVMTARNSMGKKKLKVTDSNWRDFVHWHKVLQMSEDTMKDFEREYGLTPAAATKIRRPPGGGGTDPKAKFDAYLEEIPRV